MNTKDLKGGAAVGWKNFFFPRNKVFYVLEGLNELFSASKLKRLIEFPSL